MPSTIQVVQLGLALFTLACALPAQPKLNSRALKMYDISRRQAQAPASNLTDIDILQFALTAEHLETAFYQQGFAKFTQEEFLAAGLRPEDITNLQTVGQTEAIHVTTLTNSITAAGTQPVQACDYKFGFTTADAMIATASQLENIGVSAYLGAAPLVKSPAILGVAAQIVTVEARHQTFIRTASRAQAIPSPFDTPLGVRSVFTLAATFINSCPQGSNLAITPFPSITMDPAATASQSLSAGQSIGLTSTATGATACAFTNGGLSGGSAFTPYTNNACTIPQGLQGQTYISLVSSTPADNVLTDGITVAGPMVIVPN